jgi:serine/threonine-protein kinase RsbT
MTMPPVSLSLIKPPASKEIEIRGETDAIYARGRARAMADQLGFSRDGQWRIATAVSEAATNIVKFAGEGWIHLRPVFGERPGLEFEACDRGPGIADAEGALRDGFSEGRQIGPEAEFSRLRGRGSGLPAIARMMDGLSLCNREPCGLVLRAVKYLS